MSTLPAKKTGRKKTPIDPEKVKLLASQGMYGTQIAPILGISYPAFRKRLNSDKELREALDEGKEIGIAKATQALWKFIDKGNLQAIMFFLKYRGRWMEKSDTPKISGNNNQILIINGKPLTEYSKDELLEIARMNPIEALEEPEEEEP